MRRSLFIALLVGSTLRLTACAQDGPKDAVVLVIRHAEDADKGDGLSPRGQQRAETYKDYFLNLTFDSKRFEPDLVFAAKDSNKSRRPSLTVGPFAKAANLQVDTHFGNTQSAELAGAVRAIGQGKRVLICWRHKNIPDLLRAFGANPDELLPGGKWPGATYDWLILLTYDQEGRLASSTRINEHLIPEDSQ